MLKVNIFFIHNLLNKIILSTIFIILISFILTIKEANASSEGTVTNCYNAKAKASNPSKCFIGSGNINVTITSSSTPFYDWNQMILNTVKNYDAKNKTYVWENLKSTTNLITINSVQIYNPSVATISITNTLKNNLYKYSGFDNANLPAQKKIVYDILTNDETKNLYLHTKDGLYVTNKYLPYIASNAQVLNYNYTNSVSNLTSLFTTVGNGYLPIYFFGGYTNLSNPNNPYQLGNCEDTDGNKCLITLKHDAPVSFDINYNMHILPKYLPPSYPTNKSNWNNLPLVSLFAICFVNYYIESPPNLTNMTLDGINVQNLIPESYFTDFFQQTSSYSFNNCLSTLGINKVFTQNDKFESINNQIDSCINQMYNITEGVCATGIQGCNISSKECYGLESTKLYNFTVNSSQPCGACAFNIK